MTDRPTWRCTGCGRISGAVVKPQRHWRNGAHCGPFEAVTVAPEGAVLAPAGATVVPAIAQEKDPALRYRVTTLRRYATECPRSTILASPHDTGGIDTAGSRGSLLHAAIAEILRTLWRYDNEPGRKARFERTEEAVAILREVAAKGPWIVTPADMFGVRNADGTLAQSGLVQMIGSFAQEEWKPSRFLVIEGAPPPFDHEGRMTVEIPCPDGEIRTLSGAPDLVVVAPPSTAIIIDHKQSMARPAQPREAVPEGEPIRGVQYLTDPRGDYFQLCAYGVLVMHAYPAVQTVIGRERNWRWMGPWREVTIRRDDLEHILPYLATTMMQLDQGRREGEGSEFAKPRAGKQCNTRCSVKHSCPIPAEARGLGAIDSDAAADDMAQRWRVIRALEPDMRKALKHYHETTGYCPEAGSGEVVRWKGERGDRKFGFHPPIGAEAALEAAAQAAAMDTMFMQQWADELERQTAAAA